MRELRRKSKRNNARLKQLKKHVIKIVRKRKPWLHRLESLKKRRDKPNKELLMRKSAKWKKN
jgi:hypothetical protein